MLMLVDMFVLDALDSEVQNSEDRTKNEIVVCEPGKVNEAQNGNGIHILEAYLFPIRSLLFSSRKIAPPFRRKNERLPHLDD